MESGILADITHVIFDMDGLLLDTERIYEEVYSEIVQGYGKTYTFDLKVKCMGRKATEAAHVIIDHLDLPLQPGEWIDISQTAVYKKFPEAKLLPGVSKLVQHLKDHLVPIAIATGSSSPSFGRKTLRHKEFFSVFHHILCSGDDPEVKRGKPNPDIFQVAVSRFSEPIPRPKQVLVFEDSCNGVESAIAAGMHCIMIPDQRLDREHTTKASQVLNSMEEFRPEEWGLPPYT